MGQLYMTHFFFLLKREEPPFCIPCNESSERVLIHFSDFADVRKKYIQARSLSGCDSGIFLWTPSLVFSKKLMFLTTHSSWWWLSVCRALQTSIRQPCSWCILGESFCQMMNKDTQRQRRVKKEDRIFVFDQGCFPCWYFLIVGLRVFLFFF